MMFFEGLQSYYAPCVTLLIFTVFVLTDRLFSARIKHMFLHEVGIILLIISATWADRCLSMVWLGGNAWKLRTATTFINFAFSPCSPMIFVLIYYVSSSKRRWLFYLPELINFIFCIISVSTGCIFCITPENTYHRGRLFFIPFAVSAFYLFSLLISSSRQHKPNRRVETIFLAVILAALSGATLMEVAFTIRFMIWSTTTTSMILYFLLLNIQKVLYDPLTGAFSRMAYHKRLEKINGKSACTLAIIDINGLKQFNDHQGHAVGDTVINTVCQSILNVIPRNMSLYRYGGDEFILIQNSEAPDSMKAVLSAAQKGCGQIGGQRIFFAYGVVVYRPTDNLDDILLYADAEMYRCKARMTRQAHRFVLAERSSDL
ncbi:MAG: GGDEF domain-containing protein [Intestinimonas sp.]|jgi:diguanylate cyclase (GGDEF)-like protein|nr:GGDEF domain-containing protein [Intestinimonas sp.]